MDMRILPASSVESLEETLHQCVEDLERRKLATSHSPGAAIKPAGMFVILENPMRSDEATPSPHQERGFNCQSPRGLNEKMGPRPGRVGKPHRQHRQSSKSPLKVYPADASNFRALVYEHTSMRASSSTQDVVSQPTSPLTPPSICNSSALAFMSQPSSPTTHSTRSSSPSPLSSPHTPHTGSGPYSSHLLLPSPVHTENNLYHNTHLNVPCPHPFLCDVNLNPTPNLNSNLHHNNYMPRCASTSCIGIPSDAGNVPSDNHRAQSISPEEIFARMLSLERYLFDDSDVCNPDRM